MNKDKPSVLCISRFIYLSRIRSAQIETISFRNEYFCSHDHFINIFSCLQWLSIENVRFAYTSVYANNSTDKVTVSFSFLVIIFVLLSAIYLLKSRSTKNHWVQRNLMYCPFEFHINLVYCACLSTKVAQAHCVALLNKI